MKALVHKKEKAIEMRRQGYSYNEILRVVPVAKSSLSLWLKDLPLTKDEQSVLKHRTHANVSRGRIKAASELRRRRLDRESVWFLEAKETYELSKNQTLFHTGVSLYWAEGAKRATQWSFSNSDSEMIEVMMRWLQIYANINPTDLFFRLYIHKPYAHENCEEWWATQLGVDRNQFLKTTYKPTGLGIKRRPSYKGCLKIEVRKSKHLLCKMKFWQKMLVEQALKE